MNKCQFSLSELKHQKPLHEEAFIIIQNKLGVYLNEYNYKKRKEQLIITIRITIIDFIF